MRSSVWAEPSIEHCAELMKKVFSLDNPAINLKTSNAYNTIKNAKFTWDSVANLNVNFIKNIINQRQT